MVEHRSPKPGVAGSSPVTPAIGFQLVFFMNRIKKFFSEVSVEMKKVSWPKWDELKGSTWVVVSFSIIISAFLFFIDRILSSLMQVIL